MLSIVFVDFFYFYQEATMTTYDIISDLCKQRGIAITALEKELGFGRGYIGKFKTRGTSPTIKTPANS